MITTIIIIIVITINIIITIIIIVVVAVIITIIITILTCITTLNYLSVEIATYMIIITCYFTKLYVIYLFLLVSFGILL